MDRSRPNLFPLTLLILAVVIIAGALIASGREGLSQSASLHLSDAHVCSTVISR
jgi:hypothetical protein